MDEILEILEKDARVTADEIAKMTRKKPADIKKKIAQYEKDGVILKYKTGDITLFQISQGFSSFNRRIFRNARIKGFTRPDDID
jgi:predicted HTH transcriptional regulator